MRKTSKFLALVLSALMLVSVFAVGASAKFTDVPASDAALSKAVGLLASLGVTKGTSETTFGTNEAVTRQQMAAFIYRLLKKGKSQEGGTNNSPFTDLEDATFFYMVSWANDQGIIKGTSATTFNPKGGITLQDAYVMLVRALGYEKENGNYAYPFGYINVAEKIGLDDDIPSSVKYDTKLTRGNVAILLNNAFYADMATGETGYNPIYQEIENAAKRTFIEVGKEPYTIYDTIAKDIYGVEKTIQRVVATPNYRVDDFELTRGQADDSEFVTFDVIPNNRDHATDECLGTVSFADLGLKGEADDYFLGDVVVYVKKTDDDKTEILAAESLLDKKEGVRVKFERSSKAKTQGGVYPNNNGENLSTIRVEERIKTLTGKITAEGLTGYFYNAPWEFSKSPNYNDKDMMNFKVVNLFGDEEADPEDEDYVPAFNFRSEVDMWGRGEGDYYGTDAFKRTTLSKLPEKVVEPQPLHSAWGMYDVMGWCATEMANYEADIWDSNGDGKIDYVWFKPYTFGFIDTDDNISTLEAHGEDEKYYHAAIMDTDDMYRNKIYTYGAVIDNKEMAKQGNLVEAYINGPANYIKIASKIDSKVTKTTVKTKYSADDNKYLLDNGTTVYLWNGSLKYFGALGSNGKSQANLANYKPAAGKTNEWRWPGYGVAVDMFKSSYSTQKPLEVIFKDGYICWISGDASGNYARTDYTYMVPNTGDAYSWTVTGGTSVNGIYEVKYYVDIYKNGEVTSVPVKIIGRSDAKEDRPETPIVGTGSKKAYDFSEYLNKPLISHKDADGYYYFDIVDLEADALSDIGALEDEKNPDAYYAFVAAPTQQAAFVKSGNYYKFVKKGTSDLSQIAPCQYLKVTENTRMVFKVYDKDEEEYVWQEYNADKLPNFSNTTMINDIQFVVRNNPDSTRIEELVFLYGVIEDETAASLSKVLDIRIISEASTVLEDNDDTTILYDVYDPFTAKLERGYASDTNDEDYTKGLGELVLLSNKKVVDDIDAGALFTEGDMCTSEVTVNGIKKGDYKLGYATLEGYSEDGFVTIIPTDGTISAISEFEITEDTLVRFVDFTGKNGITIKEVSADTLGSTSKTYTNGEDKVMKVFISSEEVKNEDYEKAVLVLIIKDEADAK